MRPIVTLTTDFGLKDPYVAEMKAVILNISPNANIIDLTHDIEKFDARVAAYLLACAAPYFPAGTIHVAVVDPSVGTGRRPLLIQTRSAFYVGPDNGILALAAKNQQIEHVFEITNRKYMLSKISNTFHGRDIFAAAAAHLANGTPPREFGHEIRKISAPMFVRVIGRKSTLVGGVLYVDSFGNIITNFRGEELDSMNIREILNLKIKNRKLRLRLVQTYAEVKKESVALFGSHGLLEISVNQGNAAATYKVKAGDKITIFKA